MDNEFIKLKDAILAIDKLINSVPTATEAQLLFDVKDVLYRQQRFFVNEQFLIKGGDY